MIVSCGEALVDLVPEPVPGGGPMNVAIAAARLGAPAAFLGAISDDHFGELIWAHLLANEVDLRVAQRNSAPTARAIVERDPVTRFRFERDNTADTQLTVADVSILGPAPLFLHGGTLGMFRGQTAETLAILVEHHRGPVSLDPNVRPDIVTDRSHWDHYHQRWLSCAHIYKASDEDLEWIWPARTHDSVIEELLAGPCELVAVTGGAGGARLATSREDVRIPGCDVEVVDTVGAGDTFIASMLVSLSSHRPAESGLTPEHLDRADLSRMGKRANRAASITCSRQGANPPYLFELDARVPN